MKGQRGRMPDVPPGGGGSVSAIQRASAAQRRRPTAAPPNGRLRRATTVAPQDDTKTVSLGTSKVNYIDPRIVTAWCKRYEVPTPPPPDLSVGTTPLGSGRRLGKKVRTPLKTFLDPYFWCSLGPPPPPPPQGDTPDPGWVGPGTTPSPGVLEICLLGMPGPPARSLWLNRHHSTIVRTGT